MATPDSSSVVIDCKGDSGGHPAIVAAAPRGDAAVNMDTRRLVAPVNRSLAHKDTELILLYNVKLIPIKTELTQYCIKL